MKAIKALSVILVLIALMTACEKDGDKIWLSGLEENKLVAIESNVVLAQETSNQLALSLAWTSSTLTVSQSGMYAPNALTYYIQVSTKSDFSSNVVESQEASLSKGYTGSELNTVAKNLSAVADVATTFYFRLKGSVGANTEPAYSNVVSVDVTPFAIDMSVGFILDGKKENTGRTLYSATSNSIYTGFMGATGWYNYYMQEGDGTLWGNDGVDGSAFLMSSDEATQWNFWFPDPAGCYYVEVDTGKKVWSALNIPTLTVSGDIAAEMEFDRPNVKWTTVFNATSATTLSIKLNGSGEQYDFSTGDASSKPTSVAFAQNGENIVLAAQASEISVFVPAAGKYTLVVDLSDPKGWKCEAVEGSSGPVVINPYIYLPGIDDLTSGGWNFNTTLALYNEDDLAYAGVANVNSEWGYGIYTEVDNWSDFYKLGTGDAYSGSLVAGGDTNLPAPAAGLYILDVSLKNLTYKVTAVNSSIYVVGLHDNWTFDVPLAPTGTIGEFSGAITINSASPWGFQIHTDTSWNNYFGGSDGNLYYKGSNITDDASLSPGTYLMTVNLINRTYSITQ